MRTLKQLQEMMHNGPQAEINGKWVPARPLNEQRSYKSLRARIRDAWEVFKCRAEAFTWPEGQ